MIPKFIVLNVLLSLQATVHSSLTFLTDKGAVQGKLEKSTSGKDFYSFLGIPYAKAPIGHLRFEPPQPIDPWTDVYDARKERPACPQIDKLLGAVGDEDCLFLNVYSSNLPPSKTNLSAVMVWIHGGAFVVGSGSQYLHSPSYLLNHDVVLVTFNYRLGILGFLTTGDHACPGNMGLKDQHMALEWVRDNINRFGGDPNKVTIFGVSSGAACVHYHMLVKSSQGLFHRAVTQSGNALGRWAYTNPDVAAMRGRKAAHILGCPTEPSEKMMECLKTKNTTDFPYVSVLQEGGNILAFTPTLERSGTSPFITKTPEEMAKQGDLAPVPWMSGVTANECAYMVAEALQNPHFLSSFDANFEAMAPKMLMYENFTRDHELVGRKIRHFYIGNKNIGTEDIPQLVNMFSDAILNHGAHIALQMHLPHHVAPKYFYVLTYRGRTSYSELVTNSTHDFGVSHVDDIMYLFCGGRFPIFKDGEPEKKMSDLMTLLWSNFAQTGNPTPECGTFKWTPVSIAHMSYLDLNLEPGMKPGFPFEDRMQLWDSLSLDISDTGRGATGSAHDEL